MSYSQLTQDERYHIQHHLSHQSLTQIARDLNRSTSTISREVKRYRNQQGIYQAAQAQAQSCQTGQRKHSPYKLSGLVKQMINSLIMQQLSPEQVCGYLKKHYQIQLHHSTVYQYIRQDAAEGGTLWQNLRICSKPYRKKYGGQTWVRGKVPDRVGIENRPAIVDQRIRIGDWEADTIVGKDQKSALLTLVERKTRYVIIKKLNNFKAEDTAKAMIRALKGIGNPVHTITMDNGKEFYRHIKVAKALEADTYFCRPYHS